MSNTFLLSAMAMVAITGVTLTTMKYKREDAVRTDEDYKYQVDSIVVTANPKISHSRDDILSWQQANSINGDDRLKRASSDEMVDISNRIDDFQDMSSNNAIKYNLTDKFPNQVDYEKRQKVVEVQ